MGIAAPTRSASPLPRPASRRRLLILDDEEGGTSPLARYLRDRGFTVVTAREAEEAEALLHHQTFDLVILDLALTRFGREGLAVLRSIRARDSRLPVIVLSACVPFEVEREARRLGADAILVKPQSIYDVARTADEIFARSRH